MHTLYVRIEAGSESALAIQGYDADPLERVMLAWIR